MLDWSYEASYRNAAALAVALLVMGGCSGDDYPAEVGMSDEIITVVGSEYKFEFEIDEEPDIIEGVAAMVLRSLDTEMGAKAEVHFLDNDAADLFDRKYSDRKNCPAPFFNRYASQYTLIPGNDAVSMDLEDWKVDSWKNVSRWENIVLEGQCVERVISITRISDSQQLSSSGMGDCRIFVIDSMDASSRYL